VEATRRVPLSCPRLSVWPNLFELQRVRRFGTANPCRMRYSYLEWLIRCHELDASSEAGTQQEAPSFRDWSLRHGHQPCGEDELGPTIPDSQGVLWEHAPEYPTWSFARFGMSRTSMPDGRIICIAGEYEDFSDSDFCIYNDVVVLRPAPGKPSVDLDSGEVEIYGYPTCVFAPTDFHSATLANNQLYIIGRLGYKGTQAFGATPIVTLNPSTYEIEQRVASGPAPGWIYGHHASFDAARNAIVIRGGKLATAEPAQLTSHYAAHRLHLDTMHWELIARQETHRQFNFEVIEIGSPDFCEPVSDSFRPTNVPYQWLRPEHRGVPVYILDIEGVRVTFELLYTQVKTLVEGDLPREVVDQLLKDIVANLERDTGAYWTVNEVEPS
jgi:hypothetical protein